MVSKLRAQSKSMVGFYAANVTTDDKKEGYLISEVSGEGKRMLCKRNAPETGSLHLLEFWFDKSAIEAGVQWLKKGFNMEHPVFILDEVGKFELDGFVWDNVLREILSKNNGLLIMTVRDKFLKDVINQYGLKNHQLSVVTDLT